MRSQKAGVRAALIVANADASGEQVLVPADEDNLQPVFVPHSEQILFLRSRAFEHHSPLVDNRRHKFDLFVVDRATKQVQHSPTSQTTKSATYRSRRMVSNVCSRFQLTRGRTFSDRKDSKARRGRKQPAPSRSTRTERSTGLQRNMAAGWPQPSFQSATQPANEQNFDYNIYRLTIATGNVEQLTRLKGMLGGFSVSADGKRAVLLHDGAYSLIDLSTQQLKPVQLRWP